MTVTLTNDLIEIGKDDLLIATIAPYQITSITAHRRPDREMAPASAAITPTNSPFQTQNNPYTQTPQWYVRIHMSDGRSELIQMGIVTNQGTWVNTAAGAEIARAAIAALVPVAV